MRGVAQRRLMRLHHESRIVSSYQPPDNWALVKDAAERRNRHVRRETGNVDFGIANGRRSRYRSKRTQYAVASNQNRATAAPITQRHCHRDQAAMREDHALDCRPEVLQPFTDTQVETRQLRTKQLV